MFFFSKFSTLSVTFLFIRSASPFAFCFFLFHTSMPVPAPPNEELFQNLTTYSQAKLTCTDNLFYPPRCERTFVLVWNRISSKTVLLDKIAYTIAGVDRELTGSGPYVVQQGASE